MRSSPSARRAPSPAAALAPAPILALAAARRAPSLAATLAPAASLAAAFAPALVLALAATLVAACGRDTDLRCDQSFLRFDNFGAPFIVNWCRACHSVEIPAGMRQDAPADVNFDTIADVRAWSAQIKRTAGDAPAATMPPTGGPSESERAMLVEWLRCGAP